MLFRVQVAACCLMMAAGCDRHQPTQKALPSTALKVNTADEVRHDPSEGTANQPNNLKKAVVLKNGILLDDALNSLKSAGLAPTEENPAIAVEGAAEWKLYLLGVRETDQFYLLASRTAEEKELRVREMYWWIDGVNDAKLPKAYRKNITREVTEISIGNLVDELTVQVDAP